LPPVSTTPAVPVAKFGAGVVDTGGKFFTGGAPSLANISTNFRIEMTLTLFSRVLGKMFHEKNLKQKIA
jgi:hypothetical protein